MLNGYRVHGSKLMVHGDYLGSFISTRAKEKASVRRIREIKYNGRKDSLKNALFRYSSK